MSLLYTLFVNNLFWFNTRVISAQTTSGTKTEHKQSVLSLYFIKYRVLLHLVNSLVSITQRSGERNVFQAFDFTHFNLHELVSQLRDLNVKLGQVDVAILLTACLSAGFPAVPTSLSSLAEAPLASLKSLRPAGVTNSPHSMTQNAQGETKVPALRRR